MTKKNPDVLCPSCEDLDKGLGRGGVRIDMLVVCDCDWEKEDEKNSTGI